MASFQESRRAAEDSLNAELTSLRELLIVKEDECSRLRQAAEARGSEARGSLAAAEKQQLEVALQDAMKEVASMGATISDMGAARSEAEGEVALMRAGYEEEITKLHASSGAAGSDNGEVASLQAQLVVAAQTIVQLRETADSLAEVRGRAVVKEAAQRL